MSILELLLLLIAISADLQSENITCLLSIVLFLIIWSVFSIAIVSQVNTE